MYGRAQTTRSYSLDDVDAFYVGVANISAVELIGEAVKATPPGVSETYGADLRQICQ